MISEKYLHALIRAEKKSKSQQNDEDYRKYQKFMRSASRITVPLTNLKNIKTAHAMLQLLTEELDTIIKSDHSIFEKVFLAGYSVTACSQHLKQAADPKHHGEHFKGTR
tara:strand:+ start:4540 stop:4866 length:327 start_codon:yes stop_codon:yes gene_type:complete